MVLLKPPKKGFHFYEIVGASSVPNGKTGRMLDPGAVFADEVKAVTLVKTDPMLSLAFGKAEYR